MALQPQSSPNTLDAAVRAFHAGDLTGARRRVEAVLKRDPRNADARFLLARFWLEAGELLRGRRELELLLRQMPDHAAAQMAMGQVLARLNEPGKARPHLERALELDRQMPEAWLQLAIIDEQLETVARAIARLQSAHAVLPDHPGILGNLGVVLAKAGEAAAARRAFEQALSLEEKSPLIHFNLGRLLRDSGDHERALQHYQRAIALNPNFADVHHNLGNLLLDMDRAEAAMRAFHAATRLRFAPGAQGQRNPTYFRRTTPVKLRHDIEQLTYLQDQGLIGAEAGQMIADLRRALDSLPAAKAGEVTVELPAAAQARLAPHYNRLLLWEAETAIEGPAVNPALDWWAIEADYHQRGPGITWFDGLLTPAALTALRRFCLTSTIWSEFRFANGYVGAFIEGGFCCPLLLQIARELAAALPSIFAGHPVAKMWAFKYDHQLSGIPIHADFAAVNLNFWITPDDANLDADGGGLKVWDKEAPLDWNFDTYNKDEQAIRRFIAESGAQAINVPHRQNRAVMFNSDLFHETGTVNFREGYENRRINVTMLFGKRHNAATRS